MRLNNKNWQTSSKQCEQMNLIWQLILAFGVFGCTHGGGSAEEVVERSKVREPGWVDLSDGNVRSNDTKISYVSVRSHLRDLPLGVKETQQITLDESEANLRSLVTRKITAMSEDAGVKVANISSFHKIIGDEVRAHHGTHANVTDIYYEKLQSRAAATDFKEFYKVYVRVDYFKSHLPELLRSISRKFKSSPHSDLKQLGDKMTSRIEQLLGH